MKDTLFRFNRFAAYDSAGYQKYFEKHAQKGWMFEGFVPYGMKFRRIEPCKCHFAVTYLSGDSDEVSENLRQLQEYCAHDGWILLTSAGQMHIFYNDRKNPVPIQTDPYVELESIHKSMKQEMKGYCLSILICALIFLWGQSLSSIDWLMEDSLVAAILIYPFLMLFTLCYVAGYYCWYHKMKRKYRIDGTVVIDNNTPRYLYTFLYGFYGLYDLLLLVAFVNGDYLGLLLILTNIISLLNNKHGTSNGSMGRQLNQGSTNTTFWREIGKRLRIMIPLMMVVVITGSIVKSTVYKINKEDYIQQMPLTIEDLMPAKSTQDQYTVDIDKAILLTQYEAKQEAMIDSNEITLSYTITRVKLPYLYDRCAEDILQKVEEDWITAEAAPWGADAVYQNYVPMEPGVTYTDDEKTYTVYGSGGVIKYGSMYQWILCYEDTIVELSMSFKPTEEQIAIIGEKLRNA